MMHLPGFGPKRARRLYDELGIDSLEALRARGRAPGAARPARVRRQGGGEAARAARRGPRRQARRRASCSRARSRSPSRSSTRCAPRPAPTASRSPARCGAAPTRSRTSTSSPRRPTRAAMVRGAHRAAARRVGRRPRATPGARVSCTPGMKVDLKVVAPDQFGNVLQHFTGSKNHNVALREAAVKRGLHVSEYGIKDDATGETTRCATEEERLRAARPAVDPARAARGPRRARGGRGGHAARADRARGPARRPALPHRRCPTGARTSRRCSRAPAPAATSTSRSPTTPRRTASATTSQPDALRAQIERVRALDAELDGFDAADRDRDEHPHRRVARLRRRAARRARLGRRLRAHVVRDDRGGHDGAHDRRDGASATSTRSGIRPGARSRRGRRT